MAVPSARVAVGAQGPLHAGKAPRMLVVDDEPGVAKLLQEIVEPLGFQVRSLIDPRVCLDAVKDFRPQIVITDLIMPDVNGMELLDRITAYAPDIDVMILTGYYSTDAAVEAVKRGAYDFLTKPVEMGALKAKMAKWLEDYYRRLRADSLDGELADACCFEGMIGRSPAMLSVFSNLRRIGPHFRVALLTGETGTGKELAARALHRLSPSASGPFVVCNCPAIVEDLFESELFGHKRGAFTGALSDKQGLFQSAHGGTLFLDEVAELPLAMQAKLLRFLQDFEVRPVGSTTTRQVDVRVVAATHQNLRRMVEDGRFREDLSYRLSSVQIRLPRLADRQEDLPLLVRHFLRRFATQYQKPRLTLSTRAQGLLMRHPWPGNIRELENVLSFGCMMSEDGTIDIRHLPEYLRGSRPGPGDESDCFLTIEAIQRRHALKVLERVNGNRRQAAEVLGISRATLYRLLAELDGHRRVS